MSNVHRTRDGLPMNFIDGLKVKSVDIEDLFAEQKAYTDSIVTGETTLNVTGHAANGRIDLTTEQVAKPIIRIMGTLTTNITITIPSWTSRPLAFIGSFTGGPIGGFTVTLRTLLSDGNVGLSAVTLVFGQRKLAYTTYSDIVEVGSNLYNAELAGAPTAPTAPTATNNTQIANTAYTKAVTLEHSNSTNPHPDYTVPVERGGTGATTALNAFNAIKHGATDAYAGVVRFGDPAEVIFGAANDLAVTPFTMLAALPYHMTLSPTGGLGTYAYLSPIAPSTIAPGFLLAGSDLQYAPNTAGSSSPLGTWRNMGNLSSSTEASLWLRVI